MEEVEKVGETGALTDRVRPILDRAAADDARRTGAPGPKRAVATPADVDAPDPTRAASDGIDNRFRVGAATGLDAPATSSLDDLDLGSGDLSGLLGAVLVLYADRALGPAGVREVMDRIGADQVLALVENWEEWVSFEVVLSVAIAVAELCHEPDIGRRAGEELFRVLLERGLLVLPSHVGLVDAFPDVVASMNTATELRHATVVECVPGFARIEVTTKLEGRSRFLCRTLLGLYSCIPNLRDAHGAVVESKCIHRGDFACEFQVRWRSPAEEAAGRDPWTDRVNRLQTWAANLAHDNVDGADEALEAATLLDEIRRQALRDPLTGLANRSALELRADQELERRRGTLDGLTLLFVDLDGFKGINDTYGHAAGDELLRQLAARLQGAVRDSDLVARLGGDEFVVLFPEIAEDDVVRRLVKKVLGVFRDPFRIAGERHQLAGSVGISRAPDHGDTFRELLDHADKAMYAVKRARRERAAATPAGATPPAPAPDLAAARERRAIERAIEAARTTDP
jgi:diguanylate cyclase (GGDEF)-like protein